MPHGYDITIPAYRLGAEAVNQKQGQTYGGVYLDEEDQHFLSLAFEESLLPIVLVRLLA